MPLRLSPSDRKILLVAGGAFATLIVVALLFAGNDDSGEDTATTYSAASGGAKAAYLLLKESGYRVERWEESPRNLPAEKNAVLILADPIMFPSTEERTALHSFVTRGGRLIATGPLAAMMLPQNDSVPELLQEMNWRQFESLAPTGITRAAPQITLAPQAHWRRDSSATPLYGDDQKVVVVRYPYGKGEIFWWASATPLSNAGVTRPGNLEFFLASVGAKENARVLWDEYFHGYRKSVAATVSLSPIKWMFAQLAALAVAVLITFSRRSGPVRDPVTETRLSPLEFVETLGNVYRRADAASVAVDVYYQRFRYWLTRRLGLAANTPVEELDRAVRERWRFQDERFVPTLHDCESARYHTGLTPSEALHLIQTLYSFAVELKLFPAATQEKR
ncbi:MAG: DUF4350 domain-containing protein [Terriglobales bacterium]